MSVIATCSVCGREVQVDRVGRDGAEYPVWHHPPIGAPNANKRCPGTDEPVVRGVSQ